MQKQNLSYRLGTRRMDASVLGCPEVTWMELEMDTERFGVARRIFPDERRSRSGIMNSFIMLVQLLIRRSKHWQRTITNRGQPCFRIQTKSTSLRASRTRILCTVTSSRGTAKRDACTVVF
jgi:hypothetical protein